MAYISLSMTRSLLIRAVSVGTAVVSIMHPVEGTDMSHHRQGQD